MIEQYEVRIEEIRDGVDGLSMEELKGHVLSTHIPHGSRLPSDGTAYLPLTDFATIITATILRALRCLSALNRLLLTWQARLLALHQVPRFLSDLYRTRFLLDSSAKSINDNESLDSGHQYSTADSFHAKRAELKSMVVSVGQRMDILLDSLEGLPDGVPEEWIDQLEAVETDFGNWASDAERFMNISEWIHAVEGAAVPEVQDTTVERARAASPSDSKLNDPTVPEAVGHTPGLGSRSSPMALSAEATSSAIEGTLCVDNAVPAAQFSGVSREENVALHIPEVSGAAESVNGESPMVERVNRAISRGEAHPHRSSLRGEPPQIDYEHLKDTSTAASPILISQSLTSPLGEVTAGEREEEEGEKEDDEAVSENPLSDKNVDKYLAVDKISGGTTEVNNVVNHVLPVSAPLSKQPSNRGKVVIAVPAEREAMEGVEETTGVTVSPADFPFNPACQAAPVEESPENSDLGSNQAAEMYRKETNVKKDAHGVAQVDDNNSRQATLIGVAPDDVSLDSVSNQAPNTSGMDAWLGKGMPSVENALFAHISSEDEDLIREGPVSITILRISSRLIGNRLCKSPWLPWKMISGRRLRRGFLSPLKVTNGHFTHPSR